MITREQNKNEYTSNRKSTSHIARNPLEILRLMRKGVAYHFYGEEPL